VRNAGTRWALLAGLSIALLTLAPLAAGATSHEAAEAAPAGDAVAPDVERKPWNQEEMTTLTGQLMRAVRDVRDAWRKDPAFRNPISTVRRSAMSLDQNLRDLDRRTTQLHSQIKDGAGYEDTLNIARNILVLLNDVDMNARRIMTGKPMQDKVAPAMDLFNQVAAYYGDEPLFDLEAMERADRPPRRR
jgi:hypothetical protein